MPANLSSILILSDCTSLVRFCAFLGILSGYYLNSLVKKGAFLYDQKNFFIASSLKISCLVVLLLSTGKSDLFKWKIIGDVE